MTTPAHASTVYAKLSQRLAAFAALKPGKVADHCNALSAKYASESKRISAIVWTPGKGWSGPFALPERY